MRRLSAPVLFFFLSICLFGGCGKTGQEVPAKDEKPVKVEKTVPAPSTGWNDADTYTVKAEGADREAAKEQAHHRILKDIVNVRVLNGSRYTDITKISGEFEKPLQNGKVLQENKVNGGLVIYYQIRGKGLRKKFERK